MPRRERYHRIKTDPEKYKKLKKERDISNAKRYSLHKEEDNVASLLKSRKRKQNAIHLKGGVCAICGCKYTGKNAAIFDFHHLYGKIDNIATLLRAKCTEEVLIIEINKCILVCSNCHRMLHSEEY